MSSVARLRPLKFVMLTAAISTVLIASGQSSSDLSDERKAEDSRNGAFLQELSEISKVQHDPQFAPWKAIIGETTIDAKRIFEEAHAAKLACLASGTAHSRPCDFAMAREAKVLGWIGALSGFSYANQARPWNDERTIRPQIDLWVHTDFESVRLRIIHYATSPEQFREVINRARTLRDKAAESAQVDDWAGGLIFLRHSQILMEDASVKALQQAYAR